MSRSNDEDEDLPRARRVRRQRDRDADDDPELQDDAEDDDDLDDDDGPRARRRRREPDLGDDAGMRLLLPVGRSGWAIAAGYLGLISVLCLPAPLALFAGIMALREMKRNPKLHGMGRAIFGIVMGAIGSIGFIIWIIALIASAAKAV